MGDRTRTPSQPGAADPATMMTAEDVAVLRELSSRLDGLIGEMRAALIAEAGDKGASR